MPQVNLSTLSGPGLRRLLDATRERGEAALSYQILQEMAARREGRRRRGLFLMRRPAEPKIIAVDLGDPMEPGDEVPPLPASWRPRPPESDVSASPPPKPEPEPEPEPAPRLERGRKTPSAPTVASAPAAPGAVVDVERTPPPPPPPPKRPRSVWEDDPEPPKAAAVKSKDRSRPSRPAGAAAGFAVGAAVGIALGWWVGGIVRGTPWPVAAPAAAPVRTAAPASRPPPAPAAAGPTAAEFEAAPEAPPDAAAGPPPADLRVDAPAPANATEAAREASGEAMELPPPPPPSPARGKAEAMESAETPGIAVARAPTGANGCAAEPTPADRTICGDPELRRLQGELRQAYAEALEAHADRALLRQRQLAWANARDTVSEPDRLARLYEERIRKLNAATAAARQR